MWVLVLEALVALSMLILIVWLTMGNSRRREGEKPPPEAHSERGPGTNDT